MMNNVSVVLLGIIEKLGIEGSAVIELQGC